MQKEHQPYNIQPADRLANVSEYYFSRKLITFLPSAFMNYAKPWPTGTSVCIM